MRTSLFLMLIALLFVGCKQNEEATATELKTYGKSSIQEFSFVNQDNEVVNSDSFNDKIYVADFFFTSCPGICPVMTKNMLRVHDAFAQEPSLMFISHSIDTKRDTVGALRDYAQKLGVTSDRWHFVTGDEDAIYDMATNYMITAMPDEAAPGGFAHSGHFILVDKEKRIRGIYDGTNDEEVDQLIEELPLLLNAYK